MGGATTEITGLTRGTHGGALVVIDVIRAFTTAAAAFAAGAAEIHCVEHLDEARARRDAHPGSVLMGEEWGEHPEGFDFGNSPVQFDGVDLTGRIVIQRTSNGTRGLAWTDAPLVLAAAATNATATARSAATMPPVRLVCTGDDAEDRACAELLAAMIDGRPVDPDAAVAGIRAGADQHRARWDRPRTAADVAAYQADVDACARVDTYGFAMVGRRIGPVVVLRRVDPPSTG